MGLHAARLPAARIQREIREIPTVKLGRINEIISAAESSPRERAEREGV